MQRCVLQSPLASSDHADFGLVTGRWRQYWFRAYAETWEREEVRQALESIPALQQWDDHDIFDGAGSYPPELHDSPVMLGLMRTAQKFRLLFQHHTTPTLAQKHSLFGHAGFNWVCQMGPRMAW